MWVNPVLQKQGETMKRQQAIGDTVICWGSATPARVIDKSVRALAQLQKGELRVSLKLRGSRSCMRYKVDKYWRLFSKDGTTWHIMRHNRYNKMLHMITGT